MEPPGKKEECAIKRGFPPSASTSHWLSIRHSQADFPRGVPSPVLSGTDCLPVGQGREDRPLLSVTSHTTRSKPNRESGAGFFRCGTDVQRGGFLTSLPLRGQMTLVRSACFRISFGKRWSAPTWSARCPLPKSFCSTGSCWSF